MTAAKASGGEQDGLESDTATLAELHTLLARCFEHPDDTTARAIRTGTLVEEITSRAPWLDAENPPLPESPRTAYLRTFEAYEGDVYAPPAESAYKEWWDGTDRGILSGPPAHDMESRYEALETEIPAAYPADHVALLLEYASLLLEADALAEYREFADLHLDWIPAFRERIQETDGAPFYRWAGATLESIVERTTAHANRHQHSEDQ